ncbi:MAG TPA: DUF1697 domain-containing protein [Symbiobacteriaceae bacterium]|nr:DUF1697 domain-containing protein [Symbiobacteriaceae bacterium]
MTTYIALLRAINVSGKNIIKMADLKQMFERMGLARVQTYIQSGNVLFQSTEEAAPLRQRIEAEIQSVFGLTVTVILRTEAALAQVVARCPFAVDEGLYVSFLAEAPAAAGIEKLMEYPFETEECRVLGEEVYLLYRVRVSDSKVTNSLLEKRLGVPSTARNWRTISKLLELARAIS